jgi:hypothetical protein
MALSAFVEGLQALHRACSDSSRDLKEVSMHQACLREMLGDPMLTKHLLPLLFQEPTYGLSSVVHLEAHRPSALDATHNSQLAAEYLSFAQQVVSGVRNATAFMERFCGADEKGVFLKGLLKIRLPVCELIERDFQTCRLASVRIAGGDVAGLSGLYVMCEARLDSVSYRKVDRYRLDSIVFDLLKVELATSRHLLAGTGTGMDCAWVICATIGGQTRDLYYAPCRARDMLPVSGGWLCCRQVSGSPPSVQVLLHGGDGGGV